MKKISELNSKWYWRLIKVIGFFIYSIIFIASSISIFFEFSDYNPNKLEKTKEIIIDNSIVSDYIEEIKTAFPGDDINLIDLKKVIPDDRINNVNTLAITHLIIKKLGKDLDNIQVCGIDRTFGCSGDPVGTYIEDSINNTDNNSIITISEETYNNAVNYFNSSYEIEKEALKEIEEYLAGESRWIWNRPLNDFENEYKVNLDIGGEYDYRGMVEYLLIVISVLGVLLSIFLSNFIVLRIIYYIVLGRFFPVKK